MKKKKEKEPEMSNEIRNCARNGGGASFRYDREGAGKGNRWRKTGIAGVKAREERKGSSGGAECAENTGG